MPASLYRLVRSKLPGNPNPAFLTAAQVLQTSRQVKTYLLCPTCEQRLNQNGEKWVLRHCYRGKKAFRLQDILKAATPLWPDDPDKDFLVFAASQIPAIDVAKLAYFGVSVFWRAAVCSWRTPTGVLQLQLGPYEEAFRQYLGGGSVFPPNAALWVTVSASEEPPEVIFAPAMLRRETYRQFRFVIQGITFQLFTGARIPPMIRNSCLVHSPGNLLFFASLVDEAWLFEVLGLFSATRRISNRTGYPR